MAASRRHDDARRSRDPGAPGAGLLRFKRGGLAAAALFLLGVAGASAPGCGAGDPTPPGEPGEGAALGEAQQQVVTPPTCVTIQRTLASGSVYDSQIANKSPLTTNYGMSAAMNTGVIGTPSTERQALLAFDLSAIPAGAFVTSAKITLYETTSATATINVHRVTAPWNEMLVSWQSFAGAYAAPSIASFSSGPPRTTTNLAQAVPTVVTFSIQSLMQGWIDGSIPNQGILLEQASAPNAETQYRSSEWFPVAQRPALNVCFTVTCPAGFADCNHLGADGCETPLGTVSDCGGCGNACSAPNAAPSCVGGSCGIAACNLGYGDCNGSAADGCETSLTTLTSCGGCGIACAKPNGAASCATGTCALTACNAGFFDCDGSPQNGCEALPCSDGGHCTTDAQCASGTCQNGFCATPSCSDQIKNGTETSVDCGGSCPPCNAGQGCSIDADCLGGVCAGGACQAPSCADHVKNGGETGVDCGGATCAPCGAGDLCGVGSDCASGVCTGGVCQAAVCTDGVKNGTETAVDCGGALCPPCADGLGCAVGTDCVDIVCLGGVCQTPACTDGIQNGGETDVDCGGPACAPCGVASHCQSNGDCVSGICMNGTCQAPSCNDAVKNGNETGVDCGGSCFKPETCNGVDDDCNGLVDDGLGTITCGAGACQVTVAACASGQAQACTPLAPQPELCDGMIDDDCDGVVDNGCACVNGATQSCYGAAPSTLGVGACAAGSQVCAHGQWGACTGQVIPTQELCDSVDNDCNGLVDDDLGQTVCGVGACQAMVQNCVAGQPQACLPGDPSPETCNDVDDDCNGLVDDDLPATTCGQGACQITTPSCVNGQPQACTPGASQPEQCNGIDDDCNGVVDDGNPGGGLACSTGEPGACSAGVTACSNGQVLCVRSAQPGVETCNGLDDDCDGVVDDGNPGGGAACSTGLAGACATGSTVCSGGQLACNATVQPGGETCNGVDDDCNGVVDDSIPGSGQACSTGLQGACAAGTMACAGGQITCAGSVQPGAETCDGADNNCDGVVDEGCGCINGHTQGCYGGPAGTQSVGACHAGTQTCVSGAWSACQGEALPATETCNGADDDCDGQIDEGLGTTSCGVGQCANTVPACVNGAPGTCAPRAPSAETCDGLDNDCDGQIDNGNPGGGQACSTGLLGACGAGSTVCNAGALICSQTVVAAATDDCTTAADDNCNGQVNEGCVCVPNAGQSCYSGPAGTQGIGACKAGTRTCNSQGTAYGACIGEVDPITESCATSADDNCNGTANEGCVCSPFTTTSCYSGAAGTQGVGLCKAGTKTCNSGGTAYGACTGEVIPVTESCKTAGDDNCNGTVNEGCAALSCSLYTETFDDGSADALTTPYYKVDWCNETPSPAFNTPACLTPGASIRTNGTSSSPLLWVNKGAASCSAVKITYKWYQFASSQSSIQYKQSNDTFASCSQSSFVTQVPAASFTSTQTCNSGTTTIPFGASTGVYIKLLNSNASNNAMWWDSFTVQLIGCDC
jgi:putative metal-binding protein